METTEQGHGFIPGELLELAGTLTAPAMLCSSTVSKIAAALAQAQGEFPTIPRDRTVTVRMKDKGNGQPAGSYTFSYAPLSTIREKTRPALAAAELAILQPIMLEPDGKGGQVEVLRTILLHSSGEWLACDVPMFNGTGDNKAQAYNSGATYARRLGVTLLLCIAADEDDDGNGGDQDNVRPDYERQEQQTHRGSFPKQGGGRSQQPAQQRRDTPAPQAKPKATTLPADVVAGLDAIAEGDGFKSCWGADLTGGQVSLLEARATAAGLTPQGVRDLVGTVDSTTVNDALQKLKAAANAALGG